jgi:hypothetical protein
MAVTAASATLGALSGVLGLFWYVGGQGQPVGGAVLDNGLRSPMPVIEVGPPLWVYFLAGILGAFVAAGIAFAALRASDRSDAATA